MVLAVVGAAWAVNQAASYPSSIASWGLLIALHSAGAHLRRRRAVVAGLSIAGYATLCVILHHRGAGQTIADYVLFALLTAARPGGGRWTSWDGCWTHWIRNRAQTRRMPADRQSVRRDLGFRWDTAGLVVLLVLGVASVIVIPLSGEAVSQSWIRTAGSLQALWTFVGLGFAIRTARLTNLPPRILRAWRLMLPAYSLWVIVVVLYAFYAQDRFPSPADLLRLTIPPATLLGVLAFARLPEAPAERAKLRLDAGVAAAGSLMVLWFLVLSPALNDGSATWRVLIPSIVHPIAGTAMIFSVGIVLLRGPETAAARHPLFLLIAADIVILVADTDKSYELTHRTDFQTNNFQACGWTLGLFLFALAPYVQAWYARRPNRYQFTGGTAGGGAPPRWPYLAVIPGYVLLMAAVGAEHAFPDFGLVAGALVATTLVFARQMVAAQENRRLAVTDRLTGLANRVQLYEALPRVLAKAARDGNHVGVLVIDMNGFKQVNDTLGHQAGDHLLVGFGHLLRRCVLGSDLVARLGGDEFAIVLPDLTDSAQAHAVIRRIGAAMAEPIDVGPTMIQPRASIGMALSEPGDLSSDDLINRADVAMYQSKRRSVFAAPGR